MINALIIPTTAWVRMSITNILLVDAESCGITTKEVWVLTSKTVCSGCSALAATLTTVRVMYLVKVLLGGPIIFQMVTEISLPSFTIAPKFLVSIKELSIKLTAGGVAGENLI